MNAYYRAIAQVANAIVALWRWVWSVREVGHEAYQPERVFRYPTPEPVLAYVVPLPQFAATAVELQAPVSLRKQVNLIRPFVHLAGEVAPAWERAVGRAQVAVSKVVDTAARQMDALGMPLDERLAKDDTPTLGVFEQTLTAFRLRTGNKYAIA